MFANIYYVDHVLDGRWGEAFPFQLTRRLVIFKLRLFKYVQRSRTNLYIYIFYLKSDCMRVSYSKHSSIAFFFNELSTIKKMHSLHDFFSSHFIIVLGFGGTFRYSFFSILVIMYGKPWDAHRLSSSFHIHSYQIIWYRRNIYTE